MDEQKLEEAAKETSAWFSAHQRAEGFLLGVVFMIILFGVGKCAFA